MLQLRDHEYREAGGVPKVKVSDRAEPTVSPLYPRVHTTSTIQRHWQHSAASVSHLQCLSNTFLSQWRCVLRQVCHLPDHRVSPSPDGWTGARGGARAGGLCAQSMARPQEPFPEARPAAPPQPTGGVKDFSSRRRKGQESTAAQLPRGQGPVPGLRVCSAGQPTRGERREARTVRVLPSTLGRHCTEF